MYYTGFFLLGFFFLNHPVAERADCMWSSPNNGLTASSSSWISWGQVSRLVINLQYLWTLHVWLFFHPLPSGNRKTSLSVFRQKHAHLFLLVSWAAVKLAFTAQSCDTYANRKMSSFTLTLDRVSPKWWRQWPIHLAGLIAVWHRYKALGTVEHNS